MKLVIVQHQHFLGGIGGTEKIASFLANTFAKSGYEVEIATCEKNAHAKPFFPLDEQVTIANIYTGAFELPELKPVFYGKGKNPIEWLKYKAKKKITKFQNSRLLKKYGGEENLFRSNLLVRSHIWQDYLLHSEADLIITMSISSLLEITFAGNLGIPMINSVNGRPDYDYEGRPDFLKKMLLDAYAQLAGIQILFDEYRSFVPSTFAGKIKVIANPVAVVEKSVATTKKLLKIMHVGRIDLACKQQDVAIAIFAKLAHQFPEWTLEIWGDGAELPILQKQIKDLALENRVFLKGYTQNTIQTLGDAAIFIFPSKYEGFPLALTEAMSLGIPSIGFETCSGVNLLIHQDKNGFLAKDQEEMQSYLEQLMSDEALRTHLGNQAKIDMQAYRLEEIQDKWLTFVEEVYKRSKDREA